MNIYGENIVLRAIQKEDANFLLELINDPETEKMIGGYSFPISLEDQMKWMTSQSNNPHILRCIIACKENPDVGIGTVILHDIDWKNGSAEISIKMDKNTGRGKGYASEAVRALVGYGLEEIRLNCIYSNVLDYNFPSQRLFERCGFKKDGILRGRLYKSGRYHNVIAYSFIREDVEVNG